MNLTKILLVVLLINIISGCASTLTKQDAQTIKTVSIINNFPDEPNYTIIGTTVFNNKNNVVNDKSYKEFLTKQVENLLKERGYSVISSSNIKADLVLVIIPRDVYNMFGTNGYGYYSRNFLGKSAFKKTYVAMNITPKISGKSKCGSCYGESLTDIYLQKFPNSWNELNNKKQEELKIILRKDIQKAVGIAFNKMGL